MTYTTEVLEAARRVYTAALKIAETRTMTDREYAAYLKACAIVDAERAEVRSARIAERRGFAGSLGHTFVAARENRTKCDVCGRTAGVATHNR